MAPRATRSEGEAAIPDDRTRWAWLLALALLACIRIQTMAPDPWQWDEVLLTDAVTHGIDLRAHRPHPPGYPLLVEAATHLAFLGASPYKALAVVGTVGGVLAAASRRAIWERAQPSSLALEAGPHDLGVTFRAVDGRRRAYPLVRFRWVP